MELFDGAINLFLSFIQNMQGYFLKQANYVAMICFTMSIGITAVKLAMGSTDLLKEVTKTIITLTFFFVSIWAFPLLMSHAQRFVSNLAYTAIYGSGLQYNPTGEVGSQDEFLKWIGENGEGVFVTHTEIVGGENNQPLVRKRLNINITDKQTGLISANRMMKLVIFGFTIVFKSSFAGADSIWSLAKALPDMVIALAVAVLFGFMMIMAIIQYITAIIEYTFFLAIGVLFIPTMLWEGSKFIFEKLMGSFINIVIKLLVIQIALYLATLGIIEILKMMFIMGHSEEGFVEHISWYIAVAFMTILIKMICNSAPTIAEFISGGTPRLSYGEFAQASNNVRAAGGAVAAGGAMAMAKGAGSIAGGIKSAVVNGKQAYKESGGSLTAAVLGGGGSLVKSLAHGAGDIAKTAGKTGGSLMRNFGAALSPGAPLSSEGVGRGALGGGGASSAEGAGSSGGSSGDSGGKDGKSGAAHSGDAKLNSSLNSTRAKGAMENFRERGATGNYSGIMGTLRNGVQSVGEFSKASDKADRVGDFTPKKQVGSNKRDNMDSSIPAVSMFNALKNRGKE